MRDWDDLDLRQQSLYVLGISLHTRALDILQEQGEAESKEFMAAVIVAFEGLGVTRAEYGVVMNRVMDDIEATDLEAAE